MAEAKYVLDWCKWTGHWQVFRRDNDNHLVYRVLMNEQWVPQQSLPDICGKPLMTLEEVLEDPNLHKWHRACLLRMEL